ncbi:MAG: energy transducer TonB [Bacteroidota bacterium]|nr:energy transducer TonB [Bacteroidota bacterium]
MEKWNTLNFDGITPKTTEYKASDKEKPNVFLKSDVEYGDLVKAEYMPMFPGDEAALFKYLAENIRYPESSKKSEMSGTVYVTFVIDAQGKVTNSKILRGVDFLLNDEAQRIVDQMPDWTPGLQHGIPVSVQYNLPIRFVLK